MKYTFYKQLDVMDCGATCLRMVTKQYGRDYSINKLRRVCETSKQGVSLYAISHASHSACYLPPTARHPRQVSIP